MEWLYLIAVLFDGPFRFVLGLLPLVPLALFGFALGWRLARRRPRTAAHCLPWMPLLCVLALGFAVLMAFLRPVRSLQDTLMQSQLGNISKAQAHAEIDRNYSIQGMMQRGALHYGPLSLLLFGSIGLLIGAARPEARKKTL